MTKTYYLVQMAKGTEQFYDETAKPRTLLKTYNKQEAFKFYESLPEWQPLEEPEFGNDGEEIFESPIIVEMSEDGEGNNLIRG